MKIEEAKQVKVLLDQIDTQKPEIPQFVADWIDKCDREFKNLTYIFGHDCPKKVKEWCAVYGNHQKMLQALLYGYTVEKEKLYKARDKRLHPDDNYLNFDKRSECWFFSNGVDTYSFAVKHTRKELEESGFNVFDDDNYEVIEVTE
ncbi:hypothetical protein Javan119_0042 [Streptococcus phage Javan119]|nr:phage protein [Streptococcus dysgalactiae subsp. dysgalactiae ATCC 27957]QBX14080.1 hypothetical protein Javan119_0042 [Streptococcus phage Javan119]